MRKASGLSFQVFVNILYMLLRHGGEHQLAIPLQHGRFCAGNVWLHFWPALGMLVSTTYLLCSSNPHKLAICTVLVPQILCLLLSTTYHLFMAQVKHYHAWLRIDVRFSDPAYLVPQMSTAFSPVVWPWDVLTCHAVLQSSVGMCVSVTMELQFLCRNRASSFQAFHALQICGVFGVMTISYFFPTWWGYHCQPLWGATVLTAYYGCAIAGLLVAAFAKSASARCALQPPGHAQPVVMLSRPL